MKIFAAISAPLAVLALTGAASAGAGTTWFIPDQGHATIQEAVNDPLVQSGDTLLLAPGDHEGFSFGGKALHIRAVHPDASLTTITPAAPGVPVVRAVTAEGPNTILEGVTIRDGDINADEDDPEGGAGVRILFADPTFVNCVIQANRVRLAPDIDSGGAGVYIDGGSPSFIGCSFLSNIADFLNNVVGDAYGGAVFATQSEPLFADCYFGSNVAQSTVISSSPADWTSKAFGGAVYARGSDCVFTNCSFAWNTASATAGGFGIGEPSRWASAFGGAYAGDTGEPSFITCTFTSNRALAQASQSDSQAFARGGAVSQIGEEGSVLNCTFTNNTADNTAGSNFDSARGGAVYTLAATATYSGCTFESNVVGGVHEDWGGGVFNDIGSTTAYVNCTFLNHASANHGGAIYNYMAEPFVISCDFNSNLAAYQGGAIYNMSGQPSITGSTFDSNDASQGTTFGTGGGAIFSTGFSDYEIAGCSFTGNTGDTGGAILNFENLDPTNSNNVPTIDFTTFTENTAGDHGGAVRNFKSSPVFHQCTFSANDAGASGGAVMNQGNGDDVIGAFPDFTSCTFHDNVAAANGGAIYNTQNLGVPAIDDCEFRNNSANLGGAIYNDPDSQYIGSSAISNSDFCENSPMIGTPEEADDLGQIFGFWFDQGNNDFSDTCAGGSLVCLGDTNGDSVINVDDLISVILDFGTDGSTRNSDVTSDGIVDVDDLIWIILAWGPCPQQG